MKKLYMAHPYTKRHELRKLELELEKKLKVKLINPFYDVERIDSDVISESDERGEVSVEDWNRQVEERQKRAAQVANVTKELVEGDLHSIRTSDGMVAFVYKDTATIGTGMEIFFASYVLRLPVIIFTDFPEHPWLKYHGHVVTTMEDLEKAITELKCD